MRNSARMMVRATVLVALVALGGCSGLLGRESEPTSFFLLTPTTENQTALAAREGPFVGVFPVRLAAHLDRGSIVTRTTANELDVAQFDAWGAPLAQNITSVIGENLSVLVPTERIVPMPSTLPIPTDYEVAVEIVEFVRNAAGHVELSARWMVTRNDGRQVIAVRQSGFQARDVAFDYDAIVAAMSDLLAELSRDIAAEIKVARGSRRTS